jgi:2-(1,2-epoxy-1,2-dihydrophenyl)acetyl-CoA isomerase
MMTETPILTDLTDGLLTIRFNRPDSLNSLNRALLEGANEAFARAAKDKEVRAVMLTGTGRGFCAGADLTEASASAGGGPYDMSDNLRQLYDPLVLAIARLEKPVLCAVNGIAAGAGANFALACDIVVASDKAIFLQAFARIGVVPDAGGTWFLPRQAGLAKAMGLMMLADKISAEEAERLGLIWAVLPDDSFEQEARALGLRLAKGPTQVHASIKAMLRESLGNTLETQLALESRHQSLASRSEDFREGVMAFLQKRDANFKGK